jgi:hypothetical protein
MEFFRMADLKPLTPEILLHISQTLPVPMKGLVASVGLLDEGGTVPFIARYRKEATGNLDEVQIRSRQEKLAYFRELQDRRATILASLEEQGKLTADLRVRLEAALEKGEAVRASGGCSRTKRVSFQTGLPHSLANRYAPGSGPSYYQRISRRVSRNTRRLSRAASFCAFRISRLASASACRTSARARIASRCASTRARQVSRRAVQASSRQSQNAR